MRKYLGICGLILLLVVTAVYGQGAGGVGGAGYVTNPYPIAADPSGITAKAAPVAADLVPVWDSAANNAVKKSTLQQISDAFLAGIYIPKSTLTAKGSLIGASAASTPAELAVGSNGTYLQANSATATGLQWATKPEITVGDPGYATLAAAVTAIGATETTLVLPAGSHVGGGVTVPATLSLKVLKGATITVANATTFTINGPFEAGLYQVFSCTGTGAVSFAIGSTPYVCPEWWYSGSGSWHTALNSAYTAFAGTVTIDSVAVGYVSMKLSQVYTVTNSPFAMTGDRAGEIVGVGRWKSGIYQSGTGDAVTLLPGSQQNGHLRMSDFMIKGNALSGRGLYTNASVLTLQNLDIQNHGSHGVEAKDYCWEMIVINCQANYNGGHGWYFNGTTSGDNIRWIGGGAFGNTGKGINLELSALGKNICLIGSTISQNAGGGLYAQYAQVNIDGGYFEKNTGKQAEIFEPQGGNIRTSFYDNIAAPVVTHAIYLNASTTTGRGNVVIQGNLFQGNTKNIWQGGYVEGCVIGPNNYVDGTNEIYGLTNVIMGQRGGIAPRMDYIASSATPTPNCDTADYYLVTALAVDAAFSAPTGTPAMGQKLVLCVYDAGVQKNLTYDPVFVATAVVPAATTTVGKWTRIEFEYNIVLAKWVCIKSDVTA